jgi:hypothetical protein
MARTASTPLTDAEDATYTDQEKTAGRSQKSPVFIMLPKLLAAQAREDQTGAVLVARDQVRAARNGLHGAAADNGKSVEIKQHPHADGRVKLVFTVIPRRKGRGRPKGTVAKKTAARK